MPTCPQGHSTAAADFCDVCGMNVSGPSSGSSSTTVGRKAPTPPCPECGVPLTARFCEGCGYDTMNPAEPMAKSSEWAIEIARDRAYYDRVMAEDGSDPDELPFPDKDADPTTIELVGDEMRIGRRRTSKNNVPEIDLSERVEDLAVSHEHAVLRAREDGTWVLVDADSTNGTLLNDGDDPIEPGVEIPLSDGDRIYVGAWTVLTVRRSGEEPA